MIISAGLDQSDDEALYADVPRERHLLHTESHVSVSTRILMFFGNYCCSLTFSSKPLSQLGIKRQWHKCSYGHIVFSVRKLIDQMLVMECEVSLLLVTRALSSSAC